MRLASFALVALAAHPNSLSSSELVVDGACIELALRCQMASLLEVIEGLDADESGRVDEVELAARAAEIHAYVDANYRVRVGANRDHEGGTRLAATPIDVRMGEPDLLAPPELRDWVDVLFRYEAGEPVRDVTVEMSLFLETSPDHRDVCTIRWGSDEARESGSSVFVLDAASPRARSDPEGRGAFRAFFVLGWEHILGGWDHLGFLAALLLGTRRLRSLLGVVTAFTLAHSVTLALASLGVVDPGRHAHLIEATIALSIAYVAAENLLAGSKRRTPWIEAFVFGLVHGLGFAGFLGESLVNESAKTWALVAFNLGVEAGQVAVVVVLALVLRGLPRSSSDERKEEDAAEFLAPRFVRHVGSLAVAAIGLWWFFQRV